MGDLSANFSRYEFECGCGCGNDYADPVLIERLEELRSRFGDRPITVNSGFRCESHNRKEGGGKHSQHLHGTAADIVIQGIQQDTVAAYLDERYPDSCGVGEYSTFTHFDVRPNKARWNG